MATIRTSSSQHGFSMIEVLITIIILIIGLLGLAGLQARLQVSEMESYQRAQALILLNDMASRLSANRTEALSYVTGSDNPLGAGMDCPTTTTTTAQNDLHEWCLALQGAAETLEGEDEEDTTRVGAMIGGRGCIENLDAGGSKYGPFLVTVAWQGMAPISAPPSSVACGKNAYDTADSNCTSDLCRRAITTIVSIANLSS
jgi:type IV pilus assembly protein PilV